MSCLDAIIFDFGGVITLPARIQAEMREYDRVLGWPAGTLWQYLGSGKAWEAVSTGAISEEEYWQMTGAVVESRLPPPFSRFRRGTLCYEEWDSSVLDIVRTLRGQARLGLLTNATISLRSYLSERPVLANLFDDIVVSAEVGLRKPQQAIYLLAARRLGVTPSRALIIDDKVRNVDAACQAGLQTYLYETPATLCTALSTWGLRL